MWWPSRPGTSTTTGCRICASSRRTRPRYGETSGEMGSSRRSSHFREPMTAPCGWTTTANTTWTCSCWAARPSFSEMKARPASRTIPPISRLSQGVRCAAKSSAWFPIRRVSICASNTRAAKRSSIATSWAASTLPPRARRRRPRDTNFGLPVAAYATADFDADGRVDAVAVAKGCEDTAYGFFLKRNKRCYDSSITWECENVFDVTNGFKSYNVFTGQGNVINCLDCYFIKDCRNCTNCFGSVNLRNKSYVFFNEQLTKDRI